MVPHVKEVVMKSIEIDDDLYAFIASQTKHIGESASQILRRLLLPEDGAAVNTPQATPAAPKVETAKATEAVKPAPAVKKTTAAAPKQPTKTAAPARTPKAAATAKASPQAPVSEDIQTHKKNDIVDAVSQDALATFTKRVDQFLFILSAAHKLNANSFSQVESIVGKNRTYFAKSKEALLENGSSTNPKAIPDSDYWVVTNNNTAKKVNMLEQVLRKLGYAPEVVETVVNRFAPEGK